MEGSTGLTNIGLWISSKVSGFFVLSDTMDPDNAYVLIQKAGHFDKARDELERVLTKDGHEVSDVSYDHKWDSYDIYTKIYNNGIQGYVYKPFQLRYYPEENLIKF